MIKTSPGNSTLVLSMPHSGTEIPENLPNHLKLEDPDVVRTVNSGTDYSVPHVTGFFEYNNATRIYTNVPRVLLDLNRLVEHADHLAVDNGSEELNAHGLIWRTTLLKRKEGIDPESELKDILSHPYTQEEFQHLLDQLHTPYVAQIQQAMRAAQEQHGIAIRLDLHSMPPHFPRKVETGRYKGAYLDAGRAERGFLKDHKIPDVWIAGYDPKFCSPRIVNIIQDTLGKHNLLVEPGPFPPVTESLYANAEKNLHSVGLEISDHFFSPDRLDGRLDYDPTHQAKFQEAFYDLFKTLESIEPSSLD